MDWAGLMDVSVAGSKIGAEVHAAATIARNSVLRTPASVSMSAWVGYRAAGGAAGKQFAARPSVSSTATLRRRMP